MALHFMMKFSMLITVLGFSKSVKSFWPVPYRVDLNDRKTFVITAGEDDDENDEENEMIRPDDLIEFIDLDKDEEKYKPLHSHVEHYNRRAAEAASKYSSYFPNTLSNLKENHFVEEEEKPFIAGFKHDLDKYNFNTAGKSEIHALSKSKKSNRIIENVLNKNVRRNNTKTRDRTKREEDEDKVLGTGNNDSDLVETMNLGNRTLEEDGHASPNPPEPGDSAPMTERTEEYEDEKTGIFQNVVTEDDKSVDKGITEGKLSNIFLDSELATPRVEENSEETYDYESLRAEYEQQMEEVKKNNSSYNITDIEEPEETAKDAIKKIVDFTLPKNCTEEELTKFGAQAFACLAHDYQNAKNHTDVREIVSKTWRVMKIWICIYICIAVPAWCQKGWCCCCFRCSFCFPYERIAAAKAYYSHNEPGILVDQPGKKAGKPLRYKPTLFEIDAYEDLESAIRNL